MRYSMQAGKFMTAEMRLGSRGDSYYEYLLCVFALLPFFVVR